MRLNQYEKDAIINTVTCFDPDAKIYLYGSRSDDSKYGGDIDIAVISDTIDNGIKSKIRLKLYDIIGEQKIDIVSGGISDSPFIEKAVRTGVLLNGRSKQKDT